MWKNITIEKKHLDKNNFLRIVVFVPEIRYFMNESLVRGKGLVITEKREREERREEKRRKRGGGKRLHSEIVQTAS